MDCLESIDKLTYMKPKINAIIKDRPTSVQMNHPESSLKTVSMYREVQLVNKVNSFCQSANRIENSLKNDTRESKGSGGRVHGHLYQMTHQFNIKNSKIFYK